MPAKEGGTVGGGRVSMAASGLSCRKPLISTGWAISLLFCTNGLRASISGSEAIFLLGKGDHWPRALTIASSLDNGCGLSHEYTQDGCNGTCVNLEASKST